MSETVYVVLGEQGEYSDWQQWLVAAYRVKAVARAHAENADAASRLLGVRQNAEAREFLAAWDAEGVDRYHDILGPCTYTVKEVELCDALPRLALHLMHNQGGTK